MAQDLAKIIAFIEQTGDRCIILDQAGTPAYVIMPLRQYQQVMAAPGSVSGLTEQELVEKINSDIANWKASQGTEPVDFTPITEESTAPIKGKKPKKTPEKAENIEQGGEYEFEPIE
jgi:hypothetical protein